MGGKFGRYSSDRRTSSKKEGSGLHPVWKVVGYVLMVLIPIISYAGMRILMTQSWFPIPGDLIAQPGQFLYNIHNDPLFYIETLTFLAIMFVFYVVFTLVSFYITGAMGISEKNDPFYVPPVRRTTP